MDITTAKVKWYSRVNTWLYCGYGLASWNEKMWQFSLGMSLGGLGGNMQLTAIATFAASASILLCSPSIGRWIDKWNRFKSMKATLLTGHISVCIATLLMGILLVFSTEIFSVTNGVIPKILQWISIVAFTLAAVSAIVLRTIISRDWVVVICRKDRILLTGTNARLLRVDLISMAFAPYVVGQLMHWTSIGIGCLVVAGFTVFSFFGEYWFFLKIYDALPELLCKSKETSQEHIYEMVAQNDKQNFDESSVVIEKPRETRILSVIGQFVRSWRIYARQPVFLCGVALALLYLTVMGFDSITDVYAYSQGLSPAMVAVAKGCGAFAGMMGSYAYPALARKLGLIRCGVVALGLQLACLSMAVVSIWIPGSPFDPYGYLRDDVSEEQQQIENVIISADNSTSLANGTGWVDNSSITQFLVSVVISRFGLCVVDLVILQLFQETVKQSERGVVNSVQNGFNSVLDMIKSALVIMLPDPRTFGILIIISWSSVMAGFQMYLKFTRTPTAARILLHDRSVYDQHQRKTETPSDPL